MCAMLKTRPRRYKSKAAILVCRRWATERFAMAVHQVNGHMVKMRTMPWLYHTVI